jgi:hypothetical protein
MRFYFDVRKQMPVTERAGCEFDCVPDAIDHAKAMAREMRLRPAVHHDGMRVVVVHENGALVHEEVIDTD